jgi:hypothetical protein
MFFLTLVLVGGELSASRPSPFTPVTHCIGGWVGPRAGLDDVEKRKFLTLPGLELRPLGCLASNQTALSRLLKICNVMIIRILQFTDASRRASTPAFFLTNVYSCALGRTRNVHDFSMFSCTSCHLPAFSRRASAANAVCKPTGIFTFQLASPQLKSVVCALFSLVFVFFVVLYSR